ncbi:MAG: HAD-IIIC family phosphatase [Acidobacteriia bacterium]|nr:HAD-IIIC family phosphatase [Terriglobia bacterium]
MAVLACGFTPLHLETFLTAHLRQALPGRRPAVESGLFADTAGTLEGAAGRSADAVIVPLEWADLDPRLGFRGAGAWGSGAAKAMVASARAALDRVAGAIAALPEGWPVAVALPSLPLPPLFSPVSLQASPEELALRASVVEFASRIAARRGCAVLHSSRMDEISPPAGRYDFRSDLVAGFPYTLRHADALAAGLSALVAPAASRKGLITDLDDTLWSGIVGELGPEGVTWDLSSHSQVHALYQNLLATLASEGVLIGVASKNDPANVERAFERADLLIRPEQIFPREVSWSAKSAAVERILRTWNIGADSVVFVDDSPMELAEVAAAHPGIECIRFPGNDYAAAFALLRALRDRFGKARVSAEDGLRLESIRQGEAFQQAAAGGAPETFLQQAEGEITFDFESGADDQRVLELVNKTNQFNLNGVRCGPAEWQARLARPGAVLAVIGYRDRFGPLGKIAVAQGRVAGSRLYIDTWVMSCRAFARRIEHQTLRTLAAGWQVEELFFAFRPTAKNKPLQEFFGQMLDAPPAGPFALRAEQLERRLPPLYHRVVETKQEKVHG